MPTVLPFLGGREAHSSRPHRDEWDLRVFAPRQCVIGPPAALTAPQKTAVILSTLTRRRELRPGMKRRRFFPKAPVPHPFAYPGSPGIGLHPWGGYWRKGGIPRHSISPFIRSEAQPSRKPALSQVPHPFRAFCGMGGIPQPSTEGLFSPCQVPHPLAFFPAPASEATK